MCLLLVARAQYWGHHCRLNWLQQTQVFNYTLLSPSLVDFARYNAALSSLTQLVIGLAFGKNQPGARYQCAASNTALEPCVLLCPSTDHDTKLAVTL